MDFRIERVKLLKTIAKFFGVNYYEGSRKAGSNYVTAQYRTKDDIESDKALIERYNQTFMTEMPNTEDPFALIMQRMHDLDLMICGGAINSIFTDSAVNDLDFYIVNSNKMGAADQFFRFWFNTTCYESDNANTYRRKSARSNKIYTSQLIKRFTGNHWDIFNYFDFTVTQGAYKFNTDSFAFGTRFFQDISKRKLVYLGKSKYPICAMYRTKKYQAKGYTVPGSTIMHIALSIVRLDIKTYRDLKDQLMGIDTMYLAGLLSKEEYGDELPVDYGQFLVDAFESVDDVPYSDEDQIIYPVENQ
jgi:hypothetical protein